jgi:hypothetical protein
VGDDFLDGGIGDEDVLRLKMAERFGEGNLTGGVAFGFC